MHSSAKAVLELFAAGTNAFSGPVSVTECLELVLPDFKQVVCVDIALGEDVAVYVRAGAYSSIYQNGCAEKKNISIFCMPAWQKCLTGRTFSSYFPR